MEPKELNFRLGDKHCYHDMRCWAIWERRSISPKVVRDSYTISGKSGSVLLDGAPTYEEMDYKVTLAFRTAPRSEPEAQARWREIVRWLKAGRQRLVLDSDPARYYLAQVDSTVEWSNGGWDEGKIDLVMTLQPYAYAMAESSSMADFAEAGELPLYVPSDDDVPIGITVSNTGEATLTGITIVMGDYQVALAGIACLPGDSIQIRMDAPIDAQHLHDGESLGSLIHKATAFDPLWGRGALLLAITPVWSSGSRLLTVRAYARGVAV